MRNGWRRLGGVGGGYRGTEYCLYINLMFVYRYKIVSVCIGGRDYYVAFAFDATCLLPVRDRSEFIEYRNLT